jgi:uncharacterized membrane protein YphA (DoxX/SURF4 family)
MNAVAKFAPPVLTVYVAFVFIQSLFFKFAGAPETQHIFGTLDRWAADSFGIEGLFLPPGPFNAYVVGSAELVASILLLAALFLRRSALRFAGALVGLAVISGAVFFHLFTPLGIDVQGDGGLLFGMALGVLASSLYLLVDAARQLGILRRGQ